MATMIRVILEAPTSGATVDAAAATLGVCQPEEIAVMVGNTVARQRLGSETKEALLLLARKSRSKPDPVVGAGFVRTFLGAPGLTADQLDAAAATEANAVAPTETEVGLIVGRTAALLLDRSDLVLAAVRRALDAFIPTFGL
jgi:hypothetical protein